jgi:hypothetical protein
MFYKKLKTLFCLEFNFLYHYVFLINFFRFSRKMYFEFFREIKTPLKYLKKLFKDTTRKTVKTVTFFNVSILIIKKRVFTCN